MILKFLLLITILLIAEAQYTVVSQDVGGTYIKLALKYTGSNDEYVKPKSKVIKDLVFHFKALTYGQFSFKIYDPNFSRFEVPQGGIFPVDMQQNFSFPLSLASYKINYTSSHFSFLITRKETNAVLFDSSVVQIQFSEYYLQFGTILDSKTLFGFSERFTQHFSLRPGTWTVWTKDSGQQIDYGNLNTEGVQTAGYYPAYLTRERSGLHHVAYLRTSSALDVEVQSFSNTSYLKIYRTIGGIIDFRFILGEKDPEDLLINFHNFIGKGFIPPFWSLGFHQSRWGYTNITKLETVVSKYQQNNIPLDTIWSDIDYMHEFQTFTFDTARFPLDRLKNLTKRCRYVVIIQPSLRNMKGYAYEQGKKRNVFIQAAEGGDLVGQVWAGKANFIDFFHPNSTNYWKDMLQYLYNQVEFSGLWLDMNQISNMCDGPCTPPTTQSIIDYSKDIPYQPGGKNVQLGTIPLNSTHYGKLLESNTHSLFGLMQSYNTFQFLKSKGRPFILTKSHTLGSNRFAAHWTGDNGSNFTFLKISISGHFMHALWGMQMVGSDICGFGGNASQQICSRFFQLGSLYPFSRNHNSYDSVDQQAYALGSTVLECSRKNLKLRYSLLKTYYREFLIRKGTGTIFRPLYFQFYNDANVLSDNILETQLMIGRTLMSAPILQAGKTQRTAYFPGDNWYNIHTGQQHIANSLDIVQNNLTDPVPLFLRNGYLIFQQNTQNVTKTDHLDNQFGLVAGCKMVSSNSTTTKYTATGGLLSLRDYNRNEDVQKCLAEDCDYRITITLAVNKNTKVNELTIQTTFQGKTVKNEQSIYAFTFYLQNATPLTYKPQQKVTIYQNGVQTFMFS